MFLGWERLTGIDGRQRDFCIRQLRDPKGTAEPQLMVPGDMRAMSEPCGTALARARSGDRIGIAAHLGTGDAFDRALTEAVHIGRVPREAP
jgi:hypothetical protein